jgi:hypothetical protein
LSTFYYSCRYLILPFLLTAVLLGFAARFQSQWVNWQQTIETMPYWLLGSATLIALQFNRSRLSYIGILLLVFYSLSQQFLKTTTLSYWRYFTGEALLEKQLSSYQFRDHFFPLGGTFLHAAVVALIATAHCYRLVFLDNSINRFLLFSLSR